MRLRCALAGVVLSTASSAGTDAGTRVAPIELRRSMPFVQVLVDGKGPFTFGIDTGTGSEALVAPALAEKLGLQPKGSVQAGDPSGKNPRQLPLVQVATLSVAGVELRDVTAAVYQPSQAEGPCDGILGFPLFKDWLLTLDYPASRLTLGTGRLTPSTDGSVVAFRTPDEVPVVDLVIGTEKVPAIIDSRGAGLAIPASLAERVRLLGDPVVIGRGRTISGEFEIRGAQLADDVQLGGYRFRQPFVALHPSFPVGNVGGAVLRLLVVTFDQRSKLLRIEAPERTLVLPRPQPRGAPVASDAGVPSRR
jgi:hypothetical protein